MSDLLLEMPACDPALLEEWSGKLRVCGHPTRWKILCLIERQSACVTDLWQCLDQPQPVVSQHLAALKEKGIVEASVAGNKLTLNLGFSHPIEMDVPKGLEVKVDKTTTIHITGADKAVVGQFAADIRKLRPPEPYKGKGVRYEDEFVRRKEGKRGK